MFKNKIIDLQFKILCKSLVNLRILASNTHCLSYLEQKVIKDLEYELLSIPTPFNKRRSEYNFLLWTCTFSNIKDMFEIEYSEPNYQKEIMLILEQFLIVNFNSNSLSNKIT